MHVFHIYDPNRKSEIHALYFHCRPTVDRQYNYSVFFPRLCFDLYLQSIKIFSPYFMD
jgi:hypothetical protein